MDRRDIFIAEHNAGMTMKQIAQKHGLSAQRVHQLIGGRTVETRNWFKEITPEACIYPRIRKWMNENRITRAEFTRRLWGNGHPELQSRLGKYLKGQANPLMRNINRIIEVTGLSYEELFTTDDER